ncbi:PREDICTED: uncharacterized protein LOC107345296 isoform X4 [Acropora digitifera]|uniref:uncharacterized protein LOC107345296 isoform X4 n=1 Tax=Acropora digitifera TaxID=70779 RepID=UPI00077A0A85|nr:PREDICTED: uncharacterized protein LOC107345296 isoform X4 [Acropora digitifera]
MLSATQAYLCSTFKTWAGLEELDGVAVNLPKLPKNSNTTEVKEEYLFTQIGKFVDEFVLVEFDVERAWMEARNESGRTSSGLPGSQANPLAETTSLPTGDTNSVLPSPQPNPCIGTTSLPTVIYSDLRASRGQEIEAGKMLVLCSSSLQCAKLERNPAYLCGKCRTT